MKNKLIAGIITLSVLGGMVTPTFAAVKNSSQIKNKNEINVENNSKENLIQNTKCGISGSLLHGFKFKKIWWSNNGSCGGIIIGGTINNPNNDGNINNGNSNNNSSNNNQNGNDNSNNDNNLGGNNGNNNIEITPPTGNNEKPNNPSVAQKPGDTVTPPTTEEKPSVPNIPSVDEKPGNTDEPTVDETPSIPEKPEVTPPAVEEKPDNSIGNDTINSEQSFMAEVERAIYNKVNEERAKAGVSSLTYNDVMQKYARIKSKDMGDNNYFSHEDLSGNLITTQMRNDGVSYKAWGENIAYIGGNMSADALAQQFMTNWMNSSGHRANILSDNFSSIGVGVYKIGNKVYATQEFYK